MTTTPKSKYWKAVGVIDPNTGTHRQEYFFKGIPAKRVRLTSHLARQMAGYVLIERDLRMVGEWLKAIHRMSQAPSTRDSHAWTTNDDATHVLVSGLFVAALTTYGKCFAKAEGRRIRLDVRWVPPGFEQTHERMLQMRNKFAAHSGSEDFEAVNVVLVIPVQKRRLRDEPRLYREMRQTEAVVSFEDDEFSFLELATQLQRKVLEKLDELNAKIFAEEIKPKGYAYWLGMRG
jgi:hypothetical protein